MVLNKPMGLAVQGGSGITRHIDGMLGALRGPDGQRPRLVHRLDKNTAGCLLVAKRDLRRQRSQRRSARARRARSTGRCRRSAKAGAGPHFDLSRQAGGRGGFIHAHRKAWREGCGACRHLLRSGGNGCATTGMAVAKTGNRAHSSAASAYGAYSLPNRWGSEIFNKENWEFPGGIQNRLHLLARRIAVQHPRGGIIDVSAPLPPHMEQSWNLLGFDAKRYDPIEEAPEE